MSFKALKTPTIQVFSLVIFVSAYVIIALISALGMFTNLCLVLLLLIGGPLIPKFYFQLTKKARAEVWADGRTLYK